MIDGLEMGLKEAAVTPSRIYPGIYREGLRKTMKYFSKDRQCPVSSPLRQSALYSRIEVHTFIQAMIKLTVFKISLRITVDVNLVLR
jgi:hypothetical protein